MADPELFLSCTTACFRQILVVFVLESFGLSLERNVPRCQELLSRRSGGLQDLRN